MEIRNLFKEYTQQLQNLYAGQEAENLVFWLFEYFLGLHRADLLHGKRIAPVPPELEQAIRKLMEGWPIQYILQSAPFYGRDFFVSPAVLIPRNETEELVHLIIQENKGTGLKILDLGTGSGCIPVTLSMEMDNPIVMALDISAAALEVTKTNADKFGTKIDFLQLDVLGEELPYTQLDILVSNPPYIPEGDKSLMHRNVLDHEPHLALFVPEEDPLLFYRIIAQKAKHALKPSGKLYFEINEAQGAQVVDLLSSLGYRQIRLIRDLNEKSRIAVARNS